MRTPEQHAEHCASLDGPLRAHNAITYGVVQKSIFNKCRYFHVVTGMAPDIMHDILEGVLQVNVMMLLKEFIINRSLFRIQTLNSRITSFCYGPNAASRPVPLKETAFSSASETCMKQSGKLM